MILALSNDVQKQLALREAEEGIPALELVHQAIGTWCWLTADERRTLGLCAMRLVADRRHGRSE